MPDEGVPGGHAGGGAPDDGATGDPRGASSGARLSEGTEHLQAAAKELIAAARSFLDVAEEVIDDSEVSNEVAAFLRNLVGRASEGSAHSEPDDPPRRSRVRRIDVE